MTFREAGASYSTKRTAALMAATVQMTATTFSAGGPTKSFDTAKYFFANLARTYDVSADGQRVLVIKEGAAGTETAPPPSFVVVQNWFEELKRLMPAK